MRGRGNGPRKGILVPPLESFGTPGVVRVSKLLAKKDIEARKLDTFPSFLPFFAAAQRDVRLDGRIADR